MGKYIDALKVLKGLPPPNGNFAGVQKAKTLEEVKAEEVKTEEAPGEASAAKDEKKKDDKPKKKNDSAGISPAERKELEDLKQNIIKKKADLKEQGMSGGQC